ncbi:lactonase family protein [Puniceicoccaceae bacterium K14]|nr:lactonase family protein [Puniceicoccaceae bacterium K14]
MKYLVLILSILSLTTSLIGKSVDVYFGTSGKESKGIYQAKFDTENGKLTKPTLAAEIQSPGFLAQSPNLKTLYAAGSLDNKPCVAAYRIKNDGSISFLNMIEITDGSASHLGVHPSGKFLITAQYRGGSIALFSLNKDGSLKARETVIEHEGGSGVVPNRQNSPHPHWAGFSPDGRFALIPDLGLDKIVVYQVDLDGPSIKNIGYGEAIPGVGPRHMRFSVDGKFVYLLNEFTLSVTTFGWDSENGKLETLTTAPGLTEEQKAKEVFNSSSEILVHPNGRFVYSGNRGHDTVTVYRANPKTGELSVVEIEPIRGAFPRNINLDASGRWLLAAGQDSNTISVFEIDSDSGELTFQRKSSINVPTPICILFNE